MVEITMAESERPNRNFTQVYNSHIPAIRWLVRNHPKAAEIFFFIMEEMDNGNALLCSYEVMQEKFLFSRMTVYRCIKALEDNGFISIMKSGGSNVYVLNPDVAWKTWANKKQYVRFTGTMILGRTDNPDFDAAHQKKRFSAFQKREGV